MKKNQSLLANGLLSFQHVLAMFGATVLVPFITGLDPSLALLSAGIGTLLFHLVTGGKVPVFLGSSFAFIAGIQIVSKNFGMAYATGSFMAVGALYVIISLLVFLIGSDKIKMLFPSIVTGPIIIVIGLILSPVAVGMASENWLVAIITILAVVLTGIIGKGFIKLIPIVIGIFVGYLAAFALNIIDFAPVLEASWFYGIGDFQNMMIAPKFSLEAMAVIVPIAIVSLVEHIGDITTNGVVVGRNFFKSPGLHRTLLGDGIATAFAGLIGAPANTTYSENTGVLAVTGNYNPNIIRGAAVIAIVLSFIGKFGAIIRTIPVPVMGGVSFVLFGMIASIGLRTLVESKTDFSNLKNSIIVFSILIIGIVSIQGEGNPAAIKISEYASFEGLSLAAIVGISLNAIINIIAPKLFVSKTDRVERQNKTSAKLAFEKE
ncbi:uracil-xanthine permease family protein [Desulfonispora thiosulfatigenes]|uniref:uracil-xanthine permease family protein n=1 Tax=Desulfonispora thiosulfatigenes TaxID=83661 RepID=UPI001FA91D68|nr:solute carrier family 23 protein [Desulfonispora thiosulfatigenes]